ncbi:MAG TPA: hypothetical protein VF980_19375 [Thermoanaerobaculia bacterium]
MNTNALRRPFPLFALTSAVIAATCIALVRSSLFLRNPDVAAWGATFDLTLSIPLLYYFIVVRSGSARAITIAPVFAIGAAVAGLALPHGYHQMLHDLRFAVAPLEVVTIVLLVQRVAAMRKAERSGDPFARIEAAAAQIFGTSRAASFVAAELSIVWAALLGWKRQADVPPGARSFTVHQNSGWGAIVAVFIGIIAAESVGLHLIVQMWSRTAAWILTCLDLYGILWLLGDMNALRLRPSLVTDDALRIRYGLRWSVDVPRESVAAIRRTTGESDWKRPGVLKVAMIDDPQWMIELREPLVAHGLAGWRKTVTAIAIRPDDDSALLELRQI